MDLSHTEGWGPAKALQPVQHRLRLLSMDLRVGSFGELPPVLGLEAMLIAIMAKANVWWGHSWWGSRLPYCKRSPPPHGFFDA